MKKGIETIQNELQRWKQAWEKWYNSKVSKKCVRALKKEQGGENHKKKIFEEIKTINS